MKIGIFFRNPVDEASDFFVAFQRFDRIEAIAQIPFGENRVDFSMADRMEQDRFPAPEGFRDQMMRLEPRAQGPAAQRTSHLPAKARSAKDFVGRDTAGDEENYSATK